MRCRAKVLFAITFVFIWASCSPAFAAKDVVSTLGGFSQGPASTSGGAFKIPMGVAVNKTGAGNVPVGTFYVVDSKLNRIQRFAPNGGFAAAWGWGVATGASAYEICTVAVNCRAGEGGAAAGQLGGDFFGGGGRGIAIDQSNGVVYVADQINRRIDVFSATGAFLGAFGWGAIDGTAGLQFCTTVTGCAFPGEEAPSSGDLGGGQFGGEIGGLTVDESHRIYVANRASRRVDVFTPTIPVAGIVTGIQFTRSFGWGALDGAAEFQICTASPCHAPAEIGAEPGQFTTSNPIDVAVDASGNVFALDNNATRRVQKFDSTAAPVTASFGGAAISTAFGTGELQGIAIDSGSVYVAGKRSTAGDAVAVAQLDEAGAAIDLHGTSLSATAANGLAVAPTTAGGAIFLSTSAGGNFVYALNDSTTPSMNPVITFAGTTATFSGSVVSNGAPTSYRFEYSTDGSTWSSFPVPDADAGTAPGSIPVQQEVEGLSGSQLYHVRLRATRQTPGGTVTSAETTFTTGAAAPAIASQAVSSRRDVSATLEARVNPQNQATEYHFEYVTDDAFQGSGYSTAIQVPTGSASAGSGSAAVPVSVDISGLTPSTLYHFRLVATNATGTSEGDDSTFPTFQHLSPSEGCANQAVRDAQHSNYLGDCRAIELINAPDKGTQNALTLYPLLGTPMLAPSGEEAIWNVIGGAPGGTTGTGATFLSRRTASGWQTQSLIPPAEEQLGSGEFKYQLEATTPDFSKFVFLAGKSTVGGSSNASIVRVGRNQEQETLRSFPNVPSVGLGNYGTGVDLTDDGAHVFMVNPETGQLEDIGGPTPEVISVLPEGNPAECVIDGGTSFVGESPSRYGASGNWRPGYHRFATTDASRVYFEAPPNGECSAGYGLYQRNLETDETTLIDLGGAFETDSSFMVRATPDGRSVYFVSPHQLDPADGNASADVYRWDESSGESSCLTCVVADANLLYYNSVPNAVQISDDFSHIYFQSESELVPGKGTPGHQNVYVVSDGEIHFVADLLFEYESFLGLINPQRPAQLSSDGNVLMMLTRPHEGLTDDEVSPTCLMADATGQTTCQQLYRYDDRDESLVCISCLHGGLTDGLVGTSSTQLASVYRMSADGSTVAFVTATSLLPGDINGGVDIYEWRDGMLSLITDGVGHLSQSILGGPAVRSVSADGRDIAFSAAAKGGLTGFERDGLSNLYDARIEGGFLPPSPPQHCSEESCQGPLQPPPGLDSVGSSELNGRGDEMAARKSRRGRCAGRRGKARQRCVRGQRKRDRAKRHSKATGGHDAGRGK